MVLKAQAVGQRLPGGQADEPAAGLDMRQQTVYDTGFRVCRPKEDEAAPLQQVSGETPERGGLNVVDPLQPKQLREGCGGAEAPVRVLRQDEYAGGYVRYWHSVLR